MASQEANKVRLANEGNFTSTGVHYPVQNPSLTSAGGHLPTVDASQRGKPNKMPHNSQDGNFGYPGSVISQLANTVVKQEKTVNDHVPLPNQDMGSTKISPQIPPNKMNSDPDANMNRTLNDEYQIMPGVENGNTMLFVGELHWWTTDADLESVLNQYGRVKEINFINEKASGKSKGYCQVEFYDHASAAACNEGMDGHIFNGRACVVTFANSESIKQMGASHNMNQSKAQTQQQGRNNMNDEGGRGNGANYTDGDGGRNFGQNGLGRGGNQFPNRGPTERPMRGRGGIGNRNMMGNAVGGAGAFGQSLANPSFGGAPGMMHPPQGMMGPSFDLAYMARGAGYGGFQGPSFLGMVPSYPVMNSMGFPRVAPHVNPAFFGRGMIPHGMGMMGTARMDGKHQGMWNDPNMGRWEGEEHDQGVRELSYGGEDNGSKDVHGEGSRDKVTVRSSKGEKERKSKREWSGNPEKKHREERHHDGDKYKRGQRYRDDKDLNHDCHHKEHDMGYDDEYDRGQASSRQRNRSCAVTKDNHGSRSRDVYYGK